MNVTYYKKNHKPPLAITPNFTQTERSTILYELETSRGERPMEVVVMSHERMSTVSIPQISAAPRPQFQVFAQRQRARPARQPRRAAGASASGTPRPEHYLE